MSFREQSPLLRMRAIMTSRQLFSFPTEVLTNYICLFISISAYIKGQKMVQNLTEFLSWSAQAVVAKVPQTGWLKQQKFKSHSSGGWSPSFGCQQSLVQWELCPWLVDGNLPDVPLQGRESSFLSCLFLRALILLQGLHPYDLITCQSPPST